MRVIAPAGIMPIMTYGGFKRMTGFCKTRIPAEVANALEAVKDNDEAVKVSFCSWQPLALLQKLYQHQAHTVVPAHVLDIMFCVSSTTSTHQHPVLHTVQRAFAIPQKYGIDQGTAMCKRILESGDVPGLHMYTLNMERSAVAILENLGLINEQVVHLAASVS